MAVAEQTIAACAAHIEGQVDEMVERLVSELLAAIPEFGEDDDLRRETAESARGNVVAMLSVYNGEASASDVRIAPEVVGFARGLVRRRMPLERLISSYRVGQALFWREWLGVLTELVEDHDEFVAALRISSDDLFSYLDRVVSHVVIEYEREREQWLRRAVARRTDLVQRILRGEAVDVDAASRTLSHELRAEQTALIVWAAHPDEPDRLVSRLEAAVHEVARSCGAARALTLPIGTTSVWSWIATGGPPELSALEAAAEKLGDPEIQLACGYSASGVEGFRRSNEEALRAQRVAVQASDSARLVAYPRVEAVALMSHDDAEVRQFIARELQGLAARDASAERLRETVRVFLEEGGNARRASERLFTHKNTVLYRLQRAERLLGRPVQEERLRLEIALLLVHTLGERTLPAAA
ncbi:MAG TPA: helix-turn-helix domain-containing protein [Thermoleophilaceae bacterium]|nr:helix-turn-helix domain-containing protein [Thermoleophilaceae bacterium]